MYCSVDILVTIILGRVMPHHLSKSTHSIFFTAMRVADTVVALEKLGHKSISCIVQLRQKVMHITVVQWLSRGVR